LGMKSKLEICRLVMGSKQVIESKLETCKSVMGSKLVTCRPGMKSTMKICELVECKLGFDRLVMESKLVKQSKM